MPRVRLGSISVVQRVAVALALSTAGCLTVCPSMRSAIRKPKKVQGHLEINPAPTMAFALASALPAFAPTVQPMRPQLAAANVQMMAKSKIAPMFDGPESLKGYVGEEDGFDPLKLSTVFDMVSSSCCPPGGG